MINIKNLLILLLLTCFFMVGCAGPTVSVKFSVPSDYNIYLGKKLIPNNTPLVFKVPTERSVKFTHGRKTIPPIFGVLNIIRNTTYTDLSNVKIEISDLQFKSVSDGIARIIKISDPGVVVNNQQVPNAYYNNPFLNSYQQQQLNKRNTSKPDGATILMLKLGTRKK